MLYDKYKGAKILIVGNAESVMETKRVLPDMPILRLNNSSPKGREDYVGSRTDILCVSRPIKPHNIMLGFGSPDLLWMTPNYSKLRQSPFWMRQEKYPRRRWEKLSDLLGARPSTGMMAIDYFTRFASAKITLLGFDWYKTPTYYWDEDARRDGPPKQHDFEREKLLITNFYDVRIIQ